MGDGQWYLHSFAKEQPDLSWDNREVRDDFLKTLRFWSDRGVDGFRVDVAHLLTEDLTELLPSSAELALIPLDGNHPLADRDDVQEIYAEWRELFDSYDPPRTAVAEAWVDADRIPAYASPKSLGQSFNFLLLEADFDPVQFRKIVAQNLELATRSGSSSTWVLSNHDVVRHATRYGLPNPSRSTGHWQPDEKHGNAWLKSGGVEPELDRERGMRRAEAATLFIMGLPGSTYIYQGEELGLQEAVDIPPEGRQDPTFERTKRQETGRDGCRVPLPWVAAPKEGESYGFGTGVAHLPQPEWFEEYAVDMQNADPASTLNLYRAALRLRRELQTDESLEWLGTGSDQVLAYERPNGWTVVTNFGTDPFDLRRIGGTVLLSSAPVEGGRLPGESTAWVKR